MEEKILEHGEKLQKLLCTDTVEEALVQFTLPNGVEKLIENQEAIVLVEESRKAMRRRIFDGLEIAIKFADDDILMIENLVPNFRELCKKTPIMKNLNNVMTLSSALLDNVEYVINPDPKEKLYKAKVITKDYHKVIAVKHISAGEVIYEGEALSFFKQKNKFDEMVWAHYVFENSDETCKISNLIPRTGYDIKTIYDKLCRNRFSIHGGVVVYHIGSFFNNSCTPNTHVNIAEDFSVKFTAHVDIMKKEEITINYSYKTLFIDNRELRAKITEDSLKFKCLCKACNSYKELQPMDIAVARFNARDLILMINVCVWCGTDNPTSYCNGCIIARYCSKTCQKNHWKACHHRQCAKWQKTLSK